MKKIVLTVGIAMLFVVGSATFIGCGNTENHDDAHEHAEGEGHDEGEHEHAEGEEHDHAEGEMENHDEMEAGAEEHAIYQCPMKCEGDKTYEEAGECPKCGMDIALLEE